MMKIALIGLLLLSEALHAQDYTILRFEASDYKSYTFEEMSEFMGENKDLLPHLKCNGQDELNPFQPPLRSSSSQTSLRIKVPGSTETFIYQKGRLFNDAGEEVSSADPFVRKVLKALNRFEEIETTSRMLRYLEESYFPLTIAKGNNSFNPSIPGGSFWSGIKMALAVTFFKTLRMSPGGNFFDIGVGGQILWNPDLKIDSIEEDGIRRDLDPDVALAHEMYHAFDSIRGLLDMGIVKGESYEFETVVEYRAVYFENLVRNELGIKYRKHYGDPHVPEGGDPASAPDLLDESGRPIYIASPCL